MTAWLMIAWVGMRIVIPGIASEAECKRIGAMIIAKDSTDTFRCVSYRAAHVPNAYDAHDWHGE